MILIVIAAATLSCYAEHLPCSVSFTHPHSKVGLVMPTSTCPRLPTYFSFVKKRRPSTHTEKTQDKSELTKKKKDELDRQCLLYQRIPGTQRAAPPATFVQWNMRSEGQPQARIGKNWVLTVVLPSALSPRFLSNGLRVSY